MSLQMNVAEAKAKLSELIAAAERGEEVIIARGGTPVVRLVSVSASRGPRRAFGALKAKYGWEGPPTPYETFAPDPEDAIESPLFPDDPNSA
jgi:prevent-host-death family protein